jgi:TetR/AcrR family fatty acid metabolism transcriptional regulator
LQAAVKVMGRLGYHHAQVSKIAREAGVADGTVYLYFKNKEDILISLFRETMGDIVARIQTGIQNLDRPDPVLALRKLIEVYFETLAQNTDLAMVTQIQLRQSDPEIRKKIGEIMRPYYRIIDSIIEESIRSGYFRKTIDPRIARRMIFGTMDETATAWILSGAKYDLVSLVDPVLDLLLRGILADPQSGPNKTERS